MALPVVSFPYPVEGTVVRPPGQGCLSCVHKTYCSAIYWLRRDDSRFDDHTGRACASWSNNPADIVTTVTEDDIEQNNYEIDTGIVDGWEDNQFFDQNQKF